MSGFIYLFIFLPFVKFISLVMLSISVLSTELTERKVDMHNIFIARAVEFSNLKVRINFLFLWK